MAMDKSVLPIYDKDKCIFFALGRNAMYAACKMIGLKEGDEILTPAFDCDSALQPFRILGLRLNFYRSHPLSFEVDINNICKIIKKKDIKLIHIINHFGMPQRWDEILKISRAKGIPVLEDDAYSLFSKINDRHFGTFGDMGIFSLRKNLPLYDGGALIVNNPRYNSSNINLQSKIRRKIKYTLYDGFKIIRRTPMPKNLKYKIKQIYKFNNVIDVPPPLYSDSESKLPPWPKRDCIDEEFTIDYLRPISLLSRVWLNNIKVEWFQKIIDKKRSYYYWMVDKLIALKGITILWPNLPEGVVPFCLSVLIKSNRDKFLNSLKSKYDVMAWPTLSKIVFELISDFPEIAILGKQIFQINLPSHKILEPNYSLYLKHLIDDFYILHKRYLA